MGKIVVKAVPNPVKEMSKTIFHFSFFKKRTVPLVYIHKCQLCLSREVTSTSEPTPPLHTQFIYEQYSLLRVLLCDCEIYNNNKIVVSLFNLYLSVMIDSL